MNPRRKSSGNRAAWTHFFAAAERDGSITPPDSRTRQFALGRLAQGEMNATEAKYAKELENQKRVGLILSYWFEPITLRLAPKCTLTLDFMVLLADKTIRLVDVKGETKRIRKDGTKYSVPYCQDDARAKIRACAAMFSLFEFMIVFPLKDGTWAEESF